MIKFYFKKFKNIHGDELIYLEKIKYNPFKINFIKLIENGIYPTYLKIHFWNTEFEKIDFSNELFKSLKKGFIYYEKDFMQSIKYVKNKINKIKKDKNKIKTEIIEI